MRNRCFSDACLEAPVAGLMLLSEEEGVGGKGPLGGGNGAVPHPTPTLALAEVLLGSGDAGMGVNLGNPEGLPLVPLNEADGGGDSLTPPSSSGLGGRLLEGGGLLGAITDSLNPLPVIDPRLA